MRKKLRVIFILMILALVCPVLASAAEKKDNNMQFLIEKIRADKKLFVASNMQLTEGESKLFWPVYTDYQDELFLLRARTLGLVNTYAKTYNQMDTDTAKLLLEELMAIETLGPKLRMAYLPKFKKALPDIKVIRYYQVENKINAALMFELAAKIPLIKTD